MANCINNEKVCLVIITIGFMLVCSYMSDKNGVGTAD
jgi:hypothetical protein